MKNYIALMLLLLVGGFATAQQNPIDRYFTKYQEDTSFTSIELSGKMFQMVNHIEAETEEEEEFLETFKMIKGVSVLLSEGFENGKQEYKKAIKVPGNEFENLVTIDDEEGTAQVLIKDNKGTVEEILVIAGGKDGFAVVGIWGEISLNRLADVMREIQVEAMKDFDGEAAQAGRDVSLFPNPASGGYVTVDVPSELEGGMVRVHDLNGRLVTEKNVNTTRVQIDSNDLEAGTYIVSVSKGNNRVFSEKLVVN